MVCQMMNHLRQVLVGNMNGGWREEIKMGNYKGNDNYGNPKSDYLEKLTGMTDKELASECGKIIWLSAYANNNPRSDYHWQGDACYDETKHRNKVYLYDNAYKSISQEV